MKQMPTGTSIVAVVLALGVLSILAAQYPLTVTFPMGGDAAVYVRIVRHFLEGQGWERLQPIIHSWYPLSYFIFAPFGVLPIDWPMRFVWWAVAGQIFAGAALGWLAYKLAGWRAATLCIALWALTATTLNNSYEDGTIAQLWSMGFLFLFLERVYAMSFIGAGIALLLTLLVHPYSAFMGAVAIASTLPVLLLARGLLMPHERRAVQVVFFTMLLCGVGLLILVWPRLSILKAFSAGSHEQSLRDFFLDSFIGPVLFLAPVGFLYLFKKRLTPGLLVVITFLFVALVAGFNDVYGIGVLVNRLQIYALAALILLAGCGLAVVLRAGLAHSVWRTVFVGVLFFALSLQAWAMSRTEYLFYERPGNYARLHSEERAAIAWLDSQVAAGSQICMTDANRHSEWVPALTQHVVTNLDQYPEACLQPTQCGEENFYTVFFHRREGVPGEIKNFPQRFTVVFKNEGATVYQVAPEARHCND